MNQHVVVEDSEALKQAFLRGAGLAPDAVGQLTPEMMELLGKLMAGSLQSIIDQLEQRSLVKQEVKADVTMVVVRNNNPLKFFPDSQTVLTQMLRKKMPGFMEPLESIEDANRNLRAHQRGVVEGAKASMAAMMQRLHPERFEQAQPVSGIIDKVLPSLRRSAIWSMYKKTYKRALSESHDQFKLVFGDAFIAAYEQEVERVNEDQSETRGETKNETKSETKSEPRGESKPA